MAKKMYVGVSDIARSVKNMYVGVNGVARKVRRAYVGVGGIAKQIFSYTASYFSKQSTSSDYSLPDFAGWRTGFTQFNDSAYFVLSKSTTPTTATVAIYSPELTKTSNNYTVNGWNAYMVSSNNDDYCYVFGTPNTDASLTTFWCLNTLNTKTDIEGYNTYYAGSARINDNALCAGGIRVGGTKLSTVACYKNTVRSYITDLCNARSELGFANFADTSKAVFWSGGDTSGGASSYYDIYDSQLTRTYSTNSSISNVQTTGTNVGNYVLFYGGINATNKIFFLNKNNTLSAGTLPSSVTRGGAYNINGLALLATNSSIVYSCNSSLTITTQTALDGNGGDFKAVCATGDYGLITGGHSQTFVNVYKSF